MPRQELANTFSDGLMMDLNPINTPKSVLTDCLNGTYITYNGNEFVLQNDMGNYKLKNCKLPTNFIPVGVKGYGDILYIVSYNPITKETEIGSYPAPQSIFTSGDTPNRIAEDKDLAPFNWPNDNIQSNTAKYPDIIKLDKKPLFIFTTSEEETFKLNPGDEFKLEGLSDTNNLDYIYQHLNFYVIDEDNKLYDLEDNDIYNYSGPYLDNNFRKVFWETPGWLAAQYDLYVPDKFNLNLKSLNVPEFLIINDDESATQAEGDVPLDKKEPAGNQFKVSMDLSSQITITDLLFQAELNKPANVNSNGSYKDLYVRYLIKTADPASTPDNQKSDYGLFQGITYTEEGKETPTDIIDASGTETNETGTYSYFDIPVWPHNYQDNVITTFNNIRPIWFYEKPSYDPATETFDVLNYKGVVEITAYPIIKQHTNDQTLKFTQFSTTQRFPLNTLKNSKDIFVANSIYKWSVDDDSCTVSFDIDGPFINASDITGRYEIRKFNLDENGNVTIDETQEVIFGTIPNLVLYGQNTLNIPFDENIFQKEGGMYGLSIILYQNNKHLITEKVLLIPSEVFNSFFGTHDSYWNITPQIWIGEYLKYCDINNLQFSSINIKTKDARNKSWIDYKWTDETAWKTLKFEYNNYEISDSEHTNYTNTLERALKEIYDQKFKNSSSTDIFNVEYDTRYTQNLQFRISLDQLFNTSCVGNIDMTILDGHLWSPKYEYRFKLKQVNNYQNLDIVLNNENNNSPYSLDTSNYYIYITIVSNFQDVQSYKTESTKYLSDSIDEIDFHIRWMDRNDDKWDDNAAQKHGGRVYMYENVDTKLFETNVASGKDYQMLNANPVIASLIYSELSPHLAKIVHFNVDGVDRVNKWYRVIWDNCSANDNHNFSGNYIIGKKEDNKWSPKGVLFRAYGTEQCVLVEGNSKTSVSDIISALKTLCIRYNSINQSTIYFFRPSLSNLIELIDVSINKIDIETNINSLSCDQFEFFSKIKDKNNNYTYTEIHDLNPIKQKIEDGLGYKTDGLLDTDDKSIPLTLFKLNLNYILEPNLQIKVNLTDNSDFNSFVYGINDLENSIKKEGIIAWINNIDQSSNDLIISANSREGGAYLDLCNNLELNKLGITIPEDNTTRKTLCDRLKENSKSVDLTPTNLEYKASLTSVIRASNTTENKLEKNDRGDSDTAIVDFMYKTIF